jgi:hypothetical protein
MYWVSYDEGLVAPSDVRHPPNGAITTEYFMTEDDALNRAQRLRDAGSGRAVSVSDSSGKILTLQLGAPSSVDPGDAQDVG